MSKKLILIGIGIIVLLLLWSGISVYPEWLWFGNLGFAPVFWTMILSRFGFGALIWLLLMIILWANLHAARKLNPPEEKALKTGEGSPSLFGLSGRTLNTVLLAFIFILTFYVASKGSAHWDMLLRYLFQQPFGETDPVFHRDIGFYIFSLPFYNFLRTGFMVLIVLPGLITLAWYLKHGALRVEGDFSPESGAPASMPEVSITPNAMKHLIFLGGILVLFFAWGYYLKTYAVLYSTQGPAFGASYTDVHVKILAYRFLILVCLAFSVTLFMNAFNFRKRFFWSSLAIWIGAILLFATLIPMMVQKFIVKPNELAKETPYISYNIDHTRRAYNLNKIEEVPFEVNDRLTREDVEKNDVTIKNIRIWDERPLLQTYRQLQTIRLYYDFNNVDVDRYQLKDGYRQVMLAGRELVVDLLPSQAKTWVNRHLTYTHGYGLAASPVNEVTSEGLPRLFVKDLPPTYKPGMKVERPEIYYGEKTSDYVLVNTKAREFDYPKGDKNVYTKYQGEGGVPIKSFMRRILFAIEFMDPQILFTTYLTPESKIMYNRRVKVRTNLIAPFLDYDADPYVVVSGGKLYWIQDAYTTSDMFPYSRRSKGLFNNKSLNYIRNSVKVTIDAYNGDVVYYVMNEDDPIIRTYMKIFPDLFRPFEQMPEDLKKHIRYPKDLFKIQMGTYTKYHMEDVQVFYNQEDLWQIPDELYGDKRQEMEPYYIILRLPGEQQEEFFLMTPFTPSKKDNMIGWLAARCDMPNYGNLLVYKLPKEKLVYGPMQIEARVDQQTEISREFSLWSQRGSRVIRGNLLAIPVGDTFIYVEPVYLEAKQEEQEAPAQKSQQPRGLFSKAKQSQTSAASQRKVRAAASLPELKRVIVSFGNRLFMEENLDRALQSILGEQPSFQKAVVTTVPEPGVPEDLGASALEHYRRAKESLQRGDWAEYGRELENLGKILEKMAGKTAAK